MASLDLDEIDDFLSSLDPENYSLRHAFMPTNHDDVKHAVMNGSASERKQSKESRDSGDRAQTTKSNNNPKSRGAAAPGHANAELPDADDSPGRSSSDEPSAPTSRPIREQDRFLPLAIVSRLMKECIPTSAKVSRGARHLLQECVSEFIAFVTSEAIERCLADRRKTLTGEDLMEAMRALGFDNYVMPLALYLEKIQCQLRGEHVAGSASAAGTDASRKEAEAAQDATRVKQEEEDEDLETLGSTQNASPESSPPSSTRYFLNEQRW